MKPVDKTIQRENNRSHESPAVATVHGWRNQGEVFILFLTRMGIAR